MLMERGGEGGITDGIRFPRRLEAMTKTQFCQAGGRLPAF